MIEALTMRYGGMLVHAEKCDHTSYKHLGLLCPNCNRPVYLAEESVRDNHTRKIGKEGEKREISVLGSYTPKHFRHFPDVDRATVEDCELRIRSISTERRAQVANKARLQRQKIFAAHFWKIVQCSILIEDRIESHCQTLETMFKMAFPASSELAAALLEKIIERILSGWEKILDPSLRISEESLERWERRLERHVRLAGEVREELNDLSEGAERDLAERTVSSALHWQSSIVDKKMQTLITGEAFTYLGQNRQYPMRRELVMTAIYTIIVNNCGDYNPASALPLIVSAETIEQSINMIQEFPLLNDDQMIAFTKMVRGQVVDILLTVPWADKFEELEQRELAQSGRKLT
jgi:hypothetical protein